MNFREFLLLVLAGWTAVGAIGVTASLVRRERAKALRHFLWIVGIWILYMGVLVWSSLTQPQKKMAFGADQCFDTMCFAVTQVQELPGFLVQDRSRLVRVSVRISNHDKEKTLNEKGIRAYLVDTQGRVWNESTAVSGVRLTARVAPGDSVTSEPVFKVAEDATELELVFTHGQRQPGILVIGDSDSLWHRRTVVPLGR
jgi:hypothetical protein